MTEPAPNSAAAARLARQRRQVVVAASVLIVGGVLILFVLKRVPMPMRILIGLTDLTGGIVLLVLALRKDR
jgi:uncharacterized membrane protein HdeD (DUF308 family)